MSAYSSRLIQDEHDISKICLLLEQPTNEFSILDFEELIAVGHIRAATRLWFDPDGGLAAFATVDDFNNLLFELNPGIEFDSIGGDLVDWGIACLRHRVADGWEAATLDASCEANNAARIVFFERQGFRQEEVRTFRYRRVLSGPLPVPELLNGFFFRPVNGESEVHALVDLHQAAFGTGHMTQEYRLAMMHTLGYDRQLDLVCVAPGGELAAFCVAHIDSEENERIGQKAGWTDPLGVHPNFQRRGLGKAILMQGLRALQSRGMELAQLGTSSENIAMQHLAESLGFEVLSEKLWFSKDI